MKTCVLPDLAVTRPAGRQRSRVALGLLSLALAVVVSGCVADRAGKPAGDVDSSKAVATGSELADVFRFMPVPGFRALTYEYSGARERIRTEYRLLTNNAAQVELAFVNYLKHGINPGLIAGYGDLLPLMTLSSNTLPVVRTVQRLEVLKVDSVGGRLFQLQVGNTLHLRLARQWEMKDPAGIRLNRAMSNLEITYEVRSVESGYPGCQPPIHGEIFVIRQLISDGSSVTARELHFSVQLGACVRMIESGQEGIAEEARLTHWEPLL